MEVKRKTIIGEENNEPPKNFIGIKKDGKAYEYNYSTKSGEISKTINTGSGSSESGGSRVFNVDNLNELTDPQEGDIAIVKEASQVPNQVIYEWDETLGEPSQYSGYLPFDIDFEEYSILNYNILVIDFTDDGASAVHIGKHVSDEGVPVFMVGYIAEYGNAFSGHDESFNNCAAGPYVYDAVNEVYLQNNCQGYTVADLHDIQLNIQNYFADADKLRIHFTANPSSRVKILGTVTDYNNVPYEYCDGSWVKRSGAESQEFYTEFPENPKEGDIAIVNYEYTVLEPNYGQGPDITLYRIPGNVDYTIELNPDYSVTEGRSAMIWWPNHDSTRINTITFPIYGKTDDSDSSYEVCSYEQWTENIGYGNDEEVPGEEGNTDYGYYEEENHNEELPSMIIIKIRKHFDSYEYNNGVGTNRNNIPRVYHEIDGFTAKDLKPGDIFMKKDCRSSDGTELSQYAFDLSYYYDTLKLTYNYTDNSYNFPESIILKRKNDGDQYDDFENGEEIVGTIKINDGEGPNAGNISGDGGTIDIYNKNNEIIYSGILDYYFEQSGIITKSDLGVNDRDSIKGKAYPAKSYPSFKVTEGPFSETPYVKINNYEIKPLVNKGKDIENIPDELLYLNSNDRRYPQVTYETNSGAAPSDNNGNIYLSHEEVPANDGTYTQVQVLSTTGEHGINNANYYLRVQSLTDDTESLSIYKGECGNKGDYDEEDIQNGAQVIPEGGVEVLRVVPDTSSGTGTEYSLLDVVNNTTLDTGSDVDESTVYIKFADYFKNCYDYFNENIKIEYSGDSSFSIEICKDRTIIKQIPKECYRVYDDDSYSIKGFIRKPQADGNETDTDSTAFIKNKPTIPSVIPGVLVLSDLPTASMTSVSDLENIGLTGTAMMNAAQGAYCLIRIDGGPGVEFVYPLTSVYGSNIHDSNGITLKFDKYTISGAESSSISVVVS